MIDPVQNQFHIEDRSQLIYALTEAAALEHVLMCQYLFAGASLKTHAEELRASERTYYQLERIRYWKRKLFEVAREEMQHLALAMNLLVAVGGAPTFERPNFPNTNRYYKNQLADGTFEGLTMALEGFLGPKGDEFRTIDRFLRFEKAHVEPRQQLLLVAIPPANTYDTVGVLYRAIKDALARLPNVIIDVNDQYDPSDEDKQRVRLAGRPDIQNVARTPAEAQALVDQIIFQGEGYPGGRDPKAHYQIFLRIREDLERELKADRNFEPSRALVPNPLTRRHEDTPASGVTIIDRSIDGGLQWGLLQLFAGSYEILLQFLAQLFSGNTRQSKGPVLRAIETLTFLPYMTEIISPLAEILTLVPAKVGTDERLGPGFEVTSNDFLVPSLEIATRLTFDRLADLGKSADEMVVQLRDYHLDDASDQLSFVAKTLSILPDELRSRMVYGWPPLPDSWDSTYSELISETFDDPRKGLQYDFGTHAVLELNFEGICQIRLATDPDGANIRRGVTGNGFAIGDEPDLDRVIRFQGATANRRSFCPPIGVTVWLARLLRRSTLPWVDKGEVLEDLVGAKVELLSEPKFEGRNHLVSEDGEPIDPFEIQISGKNGFSVSRRTLGIPINDMTPIQRRGSGRYPVGVFVDAEAMRANLGVIARCDDTFSFATPLEYTQSRLHSLEEEFAELKGTPAEFGREGAELEFRIRSLHEGLRLPTELDARPIRWLRYFFDARYQHFVSGTPNVDLGSLANRFDLIDANNRGNSSDRWVVQYRFGFFDTDAMCACVSGKLYVPVKFKRT